MKNSLFKILLFVLSVSIIFFAISCKDKSKESAPSVNPPSVSTPTESESVEESEFESQTDSLRYFRRRGAFSGSAFCHEYL